MKITVDIPDYDGRSLDVVWESDSEYTISIHGDDVIILANRNGLISLAKQMLYLAYNNLPEGSHIHYDSFFTKMYNKEYELVIQKDIK